MKVSKYPFKNNHKFYINWSHWMVLVIQTNLFSRPECKQTCLSNSGCFYKYFVLTFSVLNFAFTCLCSLLAYYLPLWFNGAFLPSVSFDNSPTGFWNAMFKWASFHLENSPLIHGPSLPPSVLRSGLVLSEDLHLCEDCNSTWCSLCLGSDFSQEDTLELKLFLYTYMA